MAGGRRCSEYIHPATVRTDAPSASSGLGSNGRRRRTNREFARTLATALSCREYERHLQRGGAGSPGGAIAGFTAVAPGRPSGLFNTSSGL